MPPSLVFWFLNHSLLPQHTSQTKECDHNIEDGSTFAFVIDFVKEVGWAGWLLRILVVEIVREHSSKSNSKAINVDPVPRLHIDLIIELKVDIEELIGVISTTSRQDSDWDRTHIIMEGDCENHSPAKESDRYEHQPSVDE
jgi:hypothetical protein